MSARLERDPLMSPTNDPVLERLVVLDRITITLALVFFTIEILNRLIVQ
jgi:hypothetical protein